MKKLNALSIILLIAFLTFTGLRFLTVSTYSYPKGKETIYFDEWNVRSHWDDKKRHLSDMDFF